MEPKKKALCAAHSIAHIAIGLVGGTLTGIADLGRVSGYLLLVCCVSWVPLFPISRLMTRKATHAALVAYMGFLAVGWMGASVAVFIVCRRPTAAWEWSVLAAMIAFGVIGVAYGIRNGRSTEM